MRFIEFVVLSTLVIFPGVFACPDDDSHSHAIDRRRMSSQIPLSDSIKSGMRHNLLPPPTRPLEWGDVNIIHTTDSHGWLLGHQKDTYPEPNYSGTLGDFASFVTHMKDIALKKDVDLLLVDSGDMHDGTGLSDGYLSGGVNGHESSKFLARLPYDIMAIGNHELYDYNVTLDMFKNFAPSMYGRYLTSNVNITITGSNNQSISVPVGSRYRKFTTRKGRKVTSLGVIFNFTGNAAKTTVQPVANMTNEAWFKEAIAEEPDFFLLSGHMPVQEDNWPLVFNAIRAVHATTPIFILGGHTHIRDCVQLDGRSMSLESGRFMETVGWLSAKLDNKGSTGDMTFSRRYLDTNVVTYQYHTQTDDRTFDTYRGTSITAGLNQLSNEFNLDFVYGTAPADYTVTQVPYPSNTSLLTLFASKALPYSLSVNNPRATIPNLIIAHAYSQRFDLYKGPFTKNDELTSSPYTDKFLYVSNVTYGIASQVAPFMNGGKSSAKRDIFMSERDKELYSKGYVGERFKTWLEGMNRPMMESEQERSAGTGTTLGYVTKDSCPGVGDDIVHQPLPYYDSPLYIASDPPAKVTDTTFVDLVFMDFIEPRVLAALNKLQTERNYTDADVSLYSKLLTNQVLGVYAQHAWN